MGYDALIDNSPVQRVVAVDATGAPVFANNLTAQVNITSGTITPSTMLGTLGAGLEINTSGTTSIDGVSGLSIVPLDITQSTNNFGGINVRNISTGTSASSDIACYNDLAASNNLTNYIDMGIASSTYNYATFSIQTANSGYLYTNGGSLVMGTQTANPIVFHQGGTTTADEKMRINTSGNLNVASLVATPAGGSTGARLVFGTTAGFGIYYGSGVPTVSAAQGSLYMRTDGSSVLTRMYVNTNGTTGWTNVTTAT